MAQQRGSATKQIATMGFKLERTPIAVRDFYRIWRGHTQLASGFRCGKMLCGSTLHRKFAQGRARDTDRSALREETNSINMDSLAITSPTENGLSNAPSTNKHRRRWLRIGMLDLLGMMTLACIAIGAVTAIPREYHEDRVFVAFLSGGIAVGLGIGRRFGRNGVATASLCGAIVAGGVMLLFQTQTWFTSLLSLDAGSPYRGAPWPAYMLSMVSSAILGAVVAVYYAAALQILRVGLRETIQRCRPRPWRWLLIAIVFAGTPLTALILDRMYLSGGPGPYCVSDPLFADSSDTTPDPPRTQVIASPRGRWWAIQFGQWWAVYEYRDGRMVKCRELWGVEGRPSFSPNDEFCAHRASYNKLVILRTSDWQKIAESATRLPRQEAQTVCWASDGRLLLNEASGSRTGIAVWSFENEDLKRVHFFEGQADCVPIAVSNDLKWFAERPLQLNTQRVVIRGSGKVHDVAAPPESKGLIHEFDVTRFSEDGRFLIFGKSLLDTQTGKVAEISVLQPFQFTDNDLLLASRLPYEQVQSAADTYLSRVYPHNDIDPILNRTPLGRLLARFLSCQQIVIVDPATNRWLSKFGSVRGSIVDVDASQDGRFVGALIEELDYRHRIRSTLRIWRMPMSVNG
jgi:hypothetical protein